MRARQHDVYVETGRKRVFAGSIDWPGWARSGRDEHAAIETLFAYGPRFATVLRGAGLELQVSPAGFTVVERLAGNATTDFGAPDVPPSIDAEPMDETELQRQRKILQACWGAFDRAVQAAEGKELTKGPRGGGRDLDKILDHVLGADEGYLSRLGAKAPKDATDRAARLRETILETLDRTAREGVPEGPRGGKRWTPRAFVRRSAWHVLDHTWELEDRTR